LIFFFSSFPGIISPFLSCRTVSSPPPLGPLVNPISFRSRPPGKRPPVYPVRHQDRRFAAPFPLGDIRLYRTPFPPRLPHPRVDQTSSPCVRKFLAQYPLHPFFLMGELDTDRDAKGSLYFSRGMMFPLGENGIVIFKPPRTCGSEEFHEEPIRSSPFPFCPRPPLPSMALRLFSPPCRKRHQ